MLCMRPVPPSRKASCPAAASRCCAPGRRSRSLRAGPAARRRDRQKGDHLAGAPIAINAGEDGSVVVGKILEHDTYAYGYDAPTGGFGDLGPRAASTRPRLCASRCRMLPPFPASYRYRSDGRRIAEEGVPDAGNAGRWHRLEDCSTNLVVQRDVRRPGYHPGPLRAASNTRPTVRLDDAEWQTIAWIIERGALVAARRESRTPLGPNQ